MSIQHRPDRPKPWRARIRLPDGREVSRSFERKRDAQAWLESERSKLRRGDWVDPAGGSERVADLIWEAHDAKIHLSDRSRSSYESVIANLIEPHIGSWQIGRLTPESIQRWVADLDRTYSASTVIRAYTLLSQALDYAVDRRRLAASPARNINLPRTSKGEHRYLTHDETSELAEAMPDHARAFVWLGAYAGLRPGESLALRWAQADLVGGHIRVISTMGDDRAPKDTKTPASRRRVSLPRFVTERLRATDRLGPYLVCQPDGSPYELRHFRRRVFAPAVKASIGEPMRPHDLRHTHVALLVAEGVHAKAIQMRLGHRDIRTTLNTYGHLMDGLDEAAADMLDRAASDVSRPRRGPSAVGERLFE